MGPSIDGVTYWTVLVCGGCDGVTFRTLEYNSEHYDQHGRGVPSIEIFPRPTTRKIPIWATGMNLLICFKKAGEVPFLLHQVYRSLDVECYSLSLMGIRTILERMMINEVGDKGTFNANLEAFTAAGHLSSIEKEAFTIMIDAGHAASHRGHHPLLQELEVILDALENTIARIYVHNSRIQELKTTIPQRQKP